MFMMIGWPRMIVGEDNDADEAEMCFSTLSELP